MSSLLQTVLHPSAKECTRPYASIVEHFPLSMHTCGDTQLSSTSAHLTTRQCPLLPLRSPLARPERSVRVSTPSRERGGGVSVFPNRADCPVENLQNSQNS